MATRAELMDMGRLYADSPAIYLKLIEGPAEEPYVRSCTPFSEGTVPPAGSFMIAWSGEWARLAFPTIQPTHQYAAALMATVPPSDIEIRPPWPTFYLAVPDQLVTLLNKAREPEPVTGVLAYVERDRWTWIATAKTVEYSRVCYPLKLMLDLESSADEAPAWGQAQLELDEHDDRAAFCLCRLLVNACLAMSDPTAVRAVGKAHGWKPGAPLPETSRVFQLGRPVRVDCRQSVRDYIAGGASRLPAVRWPVRGHWRNQAHGPAHGLRRLQWIEPHYKGDELAPLNVRPHVLK